ncbi:efflux RND transporter permease subunit [Aneurinibacillus sp. Ricciae_BoGa-3]|uniref:efflux RND transporter permease subunit n=1 Tax=Aneurinibacillus sp. Ricciae_BoGa-3 TaxID=3022697 RepID=UPI00233F9EEE|nr:efflux RND transporter permease subunit [Aneurinibacillus sp. Ricciae_BoGa-3]WCK55303.1 efflux RND transporter permease subunit [Aneurinibacillus sp. Ricciae_BoGa-3]
MKLADFSVERPATISVIMMLLLLVGFISIPLLRVDLNPDVTIPVAVVSTTWQGSPEEVERQVTKPIESAMATVQNVMQVDSRSRQNSSQVIVRFNYGTNLDQAILSIRDKIDRTRRQLPQDADSPIVMKMDPNSAPIMTVALTGNLDAVELKRYASDVVEPRLSTVDGVASTNVVGGKKRQIEVRLDPVKMQGYGLSINQVVQALQQDNATNDAGVIKQGDKQVNLEMSGEFASLQDIENVPVHTGNNGGADSLTIKDVGSVIDTFADVTQLARVNHIPSVSIDIVKSPDANTVQVSKGVTATIKQLQSLLPKTVKMVVVSDQAKFIQAAIQTVVEHTLLGGVLSIIVLYLFLQRIRTTLIIGIVIPISIISTFSLMYFGHQTINTVTLGGLALGLGSLVDFAIVVIESIFRYSKDGRTAKEAAKMGTAEVGAAVLASALSQIAVFAPIAFTQGLASQSFSPLALTVSFSHIAALFGALTLVPMLASKMMKSGMGEERRTLFQRGIERISQRYGRLLRWSLHHKKIVITLTLLLFAASAALVPLVGFELAPSTDQGEFKVSIQTDTGTGLDTTNKITEKVEAVIQKIPEADTIFTQVGSGGQGFNAATNRASIDVMEKPLNQRSRSTDQIVEEVRQKTRWIAGAKINVSAATTSFGRGGSPIQVVISGQDEKILQDLSNSVEKAITSVHGTRNVQNSMDNLIPQYSLKIDRVRAAQYGLTVSQIETMVRNAYGGTAATQFRAVDSSIDVLVKYPNDYTQNIENLSTLNLATSSGGQVALSQVADISMGTGPSQIDRTNQTRQITVSSDIFNANQGQVQSQVKQKLDDLPRPDGYTIELSGQTKDMNQSFNSLGFALPLATLLVYFVMVSQFESFFSPFIIMFSLPPTFIGAMLGLIVTHRSLSVNALIGMIMLIGIVVNNAIVLVDYTNQLIKKGLTPYEAIIQAGPVRLRPILMTTATTVLAMLPLVIGFGQGAEAQAPMATVVAFGLIFSTMVTLILVPVVYMIFKDLGRKIRRKPGMKSTDADLHVPSVS